MAKKQDMITDAQIEEVREIEREFKKRGGSGFREMMDTLIVGLRGKLNENDGGVQALLEAQALLTEQDPALYEPDETGEENPVQESKAGIIAKTRQQEIQEFFISHGLGHIKVPVPNVPNDEFMERRVVHEQMLFFRPATKDLSYEDFMKALGQGNHWTITSKDGRTRIGWEPTEYGYWFWAEVQKQCPKLDISWNDLTEKLNLCLLSIEEYVIVWHTHKARTGAMLDRSTLSWLRTRYQHPSDHGHSGAVCAEKQPGSDAIGIHECWSLSLNDSMDNRGGRIMEVVK